MGARYLFCYFTISKTAAAKSPPIMGAIQNNQSWLSAVPPTMTTGPKLLAGLTDVSAMGENGSPEKGPLRVSENAESKIKCLLV